jgi:hypothetical protein
VTRDTANVDVIVGRLPLLQPPALLGNVFCCSCSSCSCHSCRESCVREVCAAVPVTVIIIVSLLFLQHNTRQDRVHNKRAYLQ